MNKVILVGNIGKDPEPFITPTINGAKFSLATKQLKKEKSDWHNIVCFGKTAESVAQYLKKGAKALVEGRIEYSEYEKDGVKRYSTSIIADRVDFLDKKTDSTEFSKPKVAEANTIEDIEFYEDIPF